MHFYLHNTANGTKTFSIVANAEVIISIFNIINILIKKTLSQRNDCIADHYRKVHKAGIGVGPQLWRSNDLGLLKFKVCTVYNLMSQVIFEDIHRCYQEKRPCCCCQDDLRVFLFVTTINIRKDHICRHISFTIIVSIIILMIMDTHRNIEEKNKAHEKGWW